jgi:hypothetical protein
VAKSTCLIKGCKRPVHGRGYCHRHYEYLRVYGRPVPMTGEERFWSHVNKDGPMPEPGTLAYERGLGQCWLWTDQTDSLGYGWFYLSYKRRPAHRFAYELLKGPIPDGLEPDHLCRVHACVNPSHLEPVTHRENVLRGEALSARRARQTHCKNGHPFDEENTHISRKGERICRACRRKYAREYAQWRKAVAQLPVHASEPLAIRVLTR